MFLDKASLPATDFFSFLLERVLQLGVYEFAMAGSSRFDILDSDQWKKRSRQEAVVRQWEMGGPRAF